MASFIVNRGTSLLLQSKAADLETCGEILFSLDYVWKLNLFVLTPQ